MRVQGASIVKHGHEIFDHVKTLHLLPITSAITTISTCYTRANEKHINPISRVRVSKNNTIKVVKGNE